MGGGDLNMKKHFHPLTLENLEKVWMAEQKYKAELRKIEERKKEIEEERSKRELIEHAEAAGIMKKQEEKLDWMYSANRATSEDFLLGKEVTEDLIDEKALQARNDRRTRVFGQSIMTKTVVDLERKIKEDPLLIIKKREIAATTDIIQNSARIKQIIESTRRERASKRSSNTPAMTPRANTPLNKKSWDTPSNNHFRTPSSKKNRKEFTPRRDSPSNSRKDRKRDSHPYSKGNSDRRSDRSRKRESDRNDNITDEEKLKKMMDNAKWRATERQTNVDKLNNEEEIEKKLQEKIMKLRMGKPNAADVIGQSKMGNWSSKRYVK